MTQKLYDENSYIKEFEAVVVSCTKHDDYFEIILDKTAFFPTSGGQMGDSGYIEDAIVSETYYLDKSETEIIHKTNKAFDVGTNVFCKLDFDKRYTKMQNHTGEHIISGIIHNMFGYENVGFHLSNDSYFTCDYNGYIDPSTLSQIEKEVNLVIYQEKKVKAYYPDDISNLNYRSKKPIDGKIRIVSIEDTDMCACCAPHVSNTGEVGILKIIDAIKYKGGIRITCVCGLDAYLDYKRRVDTEKELSILLNSNEKELVSAVKDQFENINKLKSEVSKLKNQLFDSIVLSIPNNEKRHIQFFENYSMDDLRQFSNKVVDKTNGTCLALSETEKGFLFILISKDLNVLDIKQNMQANLNRKCGGNSSMISGNILSSKDDITLWFSKEII